MTSKELLYVKTVADEKNISRAAKKLFIAQPSLSQSIQRIEDSVGLPLFNRTAGGTQGRISIPGSGCKTAEKRKLPDAAQVTEWIFIKSRPALYTDRERRTGMSFAKD